MKTVLQILVLIIASLLNSQQYIVNKGTLKVYNDFRSEYVDNSTVAVWLSNGYNINQKYAVVYLNDGQMLFDACRTQNNHAWEIDKVFDKLLTGKKIKDCIVVGIWNNSD